MRECEKCKKIISLHVKFIFCIVNILNMGGVIMGHHIGFVLIFWSINWWKFNYIVLPTLNEGESSSPLKPEFLFCNKFLRDACNYLFNMFHMLNNIFVLAWYLFNLCGELTCFTLSKYMHDNWENSNLSNLNCYYWKCGIVIV